MSWLKEILEENRRTVTTWPAWMRGEADWNDEPPLSISQYYTDLQQEYNERYRRRLAALNRALSREPNKGGSMPTTNIEIESSSTEVNEYVITFSQEAAEKLKRLCGYSETMRDMVIEEGDGNSERDAYSLYHFMEELSEKLDEEDVEAWERS